MKKILLGVALAASLGVANVAQAHAVCNDNSRSISYGSGTCSWHNGVYQYYNDGDYHPTGYPSNYSGGGGGLNIDDDTAIALGIFTLLVLFGDGESPEDEVEETPLDYKSSGQNWN